MDTQTFSIKESFSSAWKIEKLQLGKFMLIGAILLGVSLVSGLVENQNWVFSLLSYILQAYLGLLWIIFSIRTMEKGSLVFRPIFKEIRPELFLKFFIMTVLVTIIIVLGTILLIIPGIIAAIGLQFAGYFLVDTGSSISESMKMSWHNTKGFRLKLFWLVILVGLVNILGALMLGVGLFITIPLTSLVLSHVYINHIKNRKFLEDKTS